MLEPGQLYSVQRTQFLKALHGPKWNLPMTMYRANPDISTQKAPAKPGKLSAAARLALLVAVSSVLLSLAFRLLMLRLYPFDGLYGQDAFFYLASTRHLLEQWASRGGVLSWLLSTEPPVSVWPLGYHLQILLASTIVGVGSLAGQIVSVLSGVLAPGCLSLVVFVLASRAGITGVAASLGALGAGVVLALHPAAVQASVVVMSDMSAAMWAALAVLLATIYVNQRGHGSTLGVACGACLGIASVTRYFYPLLLVPLALYVVLSSERHVRRRRTAWAADLLPVVIAWAAIFCAQLMYNLAHPLSGTPSATFGEWSIENFFRSASQTENGLIVNPHSPAYFYFAHPFTDAGTGAVFLLFATLGVVGLAALRRHAELSLLLGWWLLSALFYAGSPYQAGRYILSYLPAIVALFGLGLAALCRWITAKFPTGGGAALRFALVLGAVMPIAAVQAIHAANEVARMVATKREYMGAVACVDRQYSRADSEPLYSFGVTLALQEYLHVRARELYNEEQSQTLKTLDTRPPGHRGLLVLPSAGFDEQWRDTPMGALVRELRRRYSPERLPCDTGSFTVYRLR